MHRERKRRQKIIFSLLLVLLLMVSGYAAFQSRLDIKGSTKVTSNWEVLITNVTSGSPSGNAENSKDENGNVILPTWDNLSASMSADLYEAGDSMEYIVTITNRGNLDATLDEVIKTDSSNSAVLITYSGYAEGQKLYKNSSLDIKVKISYNPEYSGGEATGTSNITFSFKEADSKLDNDDNPVIEDDTIISKDDKTITYNCQENGGEESNQTSVFDIGDNVDLNVQCHKEGYIFLGWNTDKDATSVINEGSTEHTTLNNSTINTTLYGIYQKTIDITYTKDNGVKTISKESDICNIYNKTTSCDKTLPTITLDNDADNTYYELDGWYIDGTKIENPGSNHTYTDSVTVEARTTALPVMRSYSSFISSGNWVDSTPDFHNDSIRNTITEIEFVDTDEVTPPDINNTSVWDVSAKQNESVIAWLDGTKIYIGGKGGVIGNSGCSYLFYKFNGVCRINFNNNFDTSKTTTMQYMFSRNVNLDEIDGLEYFDTTNVKNMGQMFESNFKLLRINISNFNTVNVTYMGNMFCDCQNLENLDLSNFNTSIVTSMAGMFGRCYMLTELDLSNFDTSKVTTMQSMFHQCINLRTIYVLDKFVTTNVTNSTGMFSNDTKLVGGNGTVYDYNNIDKTYARIDGGVSSPGYFTDGSIPVIRSVNNTSTSNSIKVIADTYVPNGDNISKIEFSVDGGSTWHEQTDSSVAENIYTFTNLNANSNYTISIRATSENSKVKTEEYEFKTKTIIAPTYTEETYGTVEITYPEIDSQSCSNGLTCNYSLDSGSTWINVNETTKEIIYSENGNLIARVSDGNNTVSSSYALVMPSFSKKIISDNGGVTTIKGKGTPNFTQVATTDEGMFAAKDYDGNDTFYFRGAVENNYVHFANLYWRIIRVNGDGTVRMIYDGTSKHQNGEASNDRSITKTNGTIDTKAFNSKYSDNAYVGYMYGDTSNNVITEATSPRTITGLNVSSNYYFSDSYTYDPATNLFTLTGNIIQDTVGGYKDNGRSDLYTCFKTVSPDDESNNGKCSEVWKVKEYVSATSMKVEYEYTYNQTGLDSNAKYWFGTSYTYNGDNTFSIDGDVEQMTLTEYQTANKNNLYTCLSATSDSNGKPTGTCQRLLKVRKINSETSAQVRPVEYSSTSYNTAHTNTVPSTMKTYLEGTWYLNNLTAYTNKLSGSSVFCNNRQISTYGNTVYTNDGYGSHPTLYGYTRFWAYAGSNISPTLSCPNASDRFTVNSSTGNGLLNAPVGLITADEVSMAGGKTGAQNTMYYLYTGHYYWTMSPSNFYYSARAFGMYVSESGELSNNGVYYGYGVRPVINLNPENLTSFSGSGTYDDPYEVS